MEETGAYYRESSKSERKTPIQYIKRIYMDSGKMVNNGPICETAKETDIKKKLLDSVGEGEGEMIWESSTETCILPYVK